MALDSLLVSLPQDLKHHVQLIVSDPEHRVIIDNLISFALSQPRPQAATDSQSAWEHAQLDWRNRLGKLDLHFNGSAKRPSDEDAAGSQQKKQKLESSGSPLYTIHGISCSAPVRKKLDVTITSDSISLVHPTSKTVEALVSLTDLNRAFLLPTPGKAKPHFTLILMNDGSSSNNAEPNDLSHVIFGVDATLTTPLKTTSHESSPSTTTHPKNASTLPVFLDFVSHLPSNFPFHDASREKFRSNVNKEECAVTAYIGAKEGHLYFFKEGILWGEKKPCLWYAVGELAEVRAWSVTGKNVTLHLEEIVDEPDSGLEEIKEGEEGRENEAKDPPPSIEFAMIDGKELDGIRKWISSVKAGFGVSKTKSDHPIPTNGRSSEEGKGKGKGKAREVEVPTAIGHSQPNNNEEDEESDEDFNYDSDASDGGEPSSGSESESDSGDNEGVESGEEDSEDEGGIPVQPESEEDGEGAGPSKIKTGQSAQFQNLANAIAKETAGLMEMDELESE